MAWMVDLSRCNPLTAVLFWFRVYPFLAVTHRVNAKCSPGRRVDPSPEFLHRCTDGVFMVLRQDIFG